jgi:hypothetical protein
LLVNVICIPFSGILDGFLIPTNLRVAVSSMMRYVLLRLEVESWRKVALFVITVLSMTWKYAQLPMETLGVNFWFVSTYMDEF